MPLWSSWFCGFGCHCGLLVATNQNCFSSPFWSSWYCNLVCHHGLFIVIVSNYHHHPSNLDDFLVFFIIMVFPLLQLTTTTITFTILMILWSCSSSWSFHQYSYQLLPSPSLSWWSHGLNHHCSLLVSVTNSCHHYPLVSVIFRSWFLIMMFFFSLLPATSNN